MTFGAVGVIAAAVALAAGVVLLRLPGPIAQPIPDRWHKKSTPVTGGAALLIGLLVALAAGAAAGDGSPTLAYVAAGAIGAFIVGFLDDRRWIGPRKKFAGQIAVAVGVAVALHPHWLPAAVAIPAAALLLVASMNSFNFLDNIDGLAAGIAAIAAGALALMALALGSEELGVLGCAVAGSCLGFLPLNYRPGRAAALFMGDSGSHLLGLAVGAGVLLATPGEAGGIAVVVVAPLLILALPILDTSLVIVDRLAHGRPVWKGGCDHISHRLVYIGLGEREAVAALLALCAACAGVALAVVTADDALVTGAAAGLVVSLLVALASRLALVTEEALGSGTALWEQTRAPAEDVAMAGNPLMTEDLQGAVVRIRPEASREVAQDRAQAT